MKVCPRILRSLQVLILTRGFNVEKDFQIIWRVFGQVNMFEITEIYFLHKGPEGCDIRFDQKPPDPSYVPLEKRKANFVDHVQKIIDKHQGFLEIADDFSKVRTGIESVCAGVPEAPRLDRILRYSASLERDFDRTLNQLERLQRMRRGQPAAPTLNVNISG